MSYYDELTEEEKDYCQWPMVDSLRLDTAMVLWENVNDWWSQCWDRDKQTIKDDAPQYMIDMENYRGYAGTCQLRHDLMPLIEPLHLAWCISFQKNNYGESFDWDFTPLFLKECVDWSQDTGPKLKENWLEIVRRFSFQSLWTNPKQQ